MGPTELEMTLVGKDGQNMCVAFSPAGLQEFIDTMFEFAYRLGNNMRPDGPVTDRTGIPTTSVQNTIAASISVGNLDANYPDELLVCFRVWATDIGLRINAKDLRSFLVRLDQRPNLH